MSEWEAFLAQARSDYAVFELLLDMRREDVPECHPLHYLQMATEKLAKAFFLALGVPFSYNHSTFDIIFHHFNRRNTARILGWKDHKAFRAFVRGLRPLFRWVVELHPSVGRARSTTALQTQPNVEYPWYSRGEGGAMIWRAPAHHDFHAAANLRSARGPQFMDLISRLLDRFERVVGQRT